MMQKHKLFRITGLITQKTLEKFRLFSQRLNDLDKVILFVDSKGGCLYSTLVMFQEFSKLKVEKNLLILSLGYEKICSSATLLFLLGDIRMMYNNCRFIIHSPTPVSANIPVLTATQLQYIKDKYKCMTYLTDEVLDIAFNTEKIFTPEEILEYRITTFNLNRNIKAKKI